MTKTKRIIIIVVTAILALAVIIVGTVGIMFREEIKIIGSLKTLEGKQAYYLEYDEDYHFDEFLKNGGATTDKEVSAFLTNKISHGFYSVSIEDNGSACTTVSAKAADGSHLWGRNYDWKGAVPIIVKCTPKDGYPSISTCDFQNITSDSKALPDNLARKMLAVASLYVPIDGINSAGLCVADLEVNEGGMAEVDTEKPDLTITTAIRLILNKAATVEEAVNLLKQYDIHASGDISHHLAISDASGASVSVEFNESEIKAVDTNVVTNFNLAIGDTSAGGESSQNRYNWTRNRYIENDGIFTPEETRAAMFSAMQIGEFSTQWTMIYNGRAGTVDYYLNADFKKAYSFSI